MKEIEQTLDNLKTKYRDAFGFAMNEINKFIVELRPDDALDLLQDFPSDSDGKNWQIKVLDLLENKLSKDVLLKWNELLKKRKEFNCACCGTCCKLACSEFSYDELLNKAKNGDNFAMQFTSIFLPYKSKEEAKKIYPEYIDLLDKNKNEDVYFYYCPKLNKNNKCCDYENRPQICRDFPDNPLALLPKSCGFKLWKQRIEEKALVCHALLQIIAYYIENLNKKI